MEIHEAIEKINKFVNVGILYGKLTMTECQLNDIKEAIIVFVNDYMEKQMSCKNYLKILKSRNEELSLENQKLKFINSRQQGNLYTFFKDGKQENLLKKYCWCQKPTNTTMSLRRFVSNGEIEGFMSESLADMRDLEWIDLNEFIFNFVKPIVKEKMELSNKCKEQEKIIKSMAEYMATHKYIGYDFEHAFPQEIIEEFKKKAR